MREYAMKKYALSKEVYRNKILGCWMGKNAGGTLGAPLEKMWGEKEPFHIDFYPEIREGGIPNDDLEIQLLWLLALEERGIDITCRDLVEYWMDFIRYNPDEYGLHKTNIRKGMSPPVSGWYNNAFRDCMGSPIRSEIWACITPGLPAVAAHYAWHDAVVDHAMGESVYGEMYNAALESAAFFISDPQRLMDIGLSVIPENCKTAQTIRFAREAFARGMDWLQARNAVMEFAWSPIAQYSPINLGFQTLGWLYGKDFGDMLCKAVNCGWDTDCTGATLGSILGIIMGADHLPENWTKPLGRVLATSEASGGLKSGPYPKDVDTLTDRTMKIGEILLARFKHLISLTDGKPSPLEVEEIPPIDHREILEIRARRQDAVLYNTSALSIQICYPEQPVVSAIKDLPVEMIMKNRCSDAIRGMFLVDLPRGFEAKDIRVNEFVIPSMESFTSRMRIHVKKADFINITNRGWVKLILEDRSTPESIPLVLIGAHRWLASPAFPGRSLEDPDDGMPPLTFPKPARGWRIMNFTGNALAIESFFKKHPGIIYLQHFVKNPRPRSVRIGAPNSHRMKLWMNGKLIKTTEQIVPLRPNLSGDGSNYADVEMPKGWHHFLVKIERGKEPIEAHFLISLLPWCDGMGDMEETRFPWESPGFDIAECHFLDESKRNFTYQLG